ncbi:MAG: phosphonopyruvate decarboxylase [Rhodospirillales bacterium]|jgi:phosphonopyruvate decarboxylase|nr:phosphonopyruvate decarboxylase [Rhodospirillales bacterium]
MIRADDFINPAHGRGFDFYSGVPCSFLTPFINRSITSEKTDYVGAASEGEAVAIAAGAWLAGRKTVVMCQNSGLGNCVNPLTSLNYPFRIPTLLITTWRGKPGLKDEPQHELMGQVTQSLMTTLQIPQMSFPHMPEEIEPALDAAEKAIAADGLPFGFIMEKGTVAKEPLDQQPGEPKPPGEHMDFTGGGGLATRYQTLESVLESVSDETTIIATTGKCGRELFTIADRPQHLYQVGSMGGVSGMGLGVALNTAKPVILLDGDGALLMKMGSLATIGAHAPKNLFHIVLDNGVHDSTGGQATVSQHVDFAAVALACGYRRAVTSNSIEGFRIALSSSLLQEGPTLLHTKIQPGSLDQLGRPTVKPADIARRFRDFVVG